MSAAARLAGAVLVAALAVSPAAADPGAVPGATMSAVPRSRPALPPYEPDGPRVEFRVVLPAAAARALKAFDPDFRVWRQSEYKTADLRRYPFSLQSTPSAVVGDFNGDGRPDAALAGPDGRGPQVLVVLSTRTAYRVVPIEPNDFFKRLRREGRPLPRAPFDALSFLPKRKVLNLGEDVERIFVLPTDGFKRTELDAYDFNAGYADQTVYWWDSPDGTPQSHAVSSEEQDYGFATLALLRWRPPSWPAWKTDDPHVECRVVLSGAMSRALAAADPDFTPWPQSAYSAGVQNYPFSLQSTPSAVIGDFNGDGRLDAALAGRGRTGARLLAVVSAGTDYRVVTLRRGARIDRLEPAARGAVYELAADAAGGLWRPFTMPGDGFTDARPARGSGRRSGRSLYWWDAAASSWRRAAVFEPPR